jgi:Sucrase/ferredoxin-like
MPNPTEAGDSFHGSAPEAAKAWLLVEHPGPWPAFDLPQDLPRALADYAAGALAHGVRTQLIRRTDRRGRREQAGQRTSGGHWGPGGAGGEAGASRCPDGPSAVLLAGGPSDSRWLVRVDPLTWPTLLGLDPARFLDPTPPLPGTKQEAALLVCTHGRREVCCAQYGRPLARTLAAEYGPMVWETTHVGGDEYAANLVLLPSGAYFGRMAPEEAVSVVERALAGDFNYEHYRGTAGLPAPVQAADCLLRHAFPLPGKAAAVGPAASTAGSTASGRTRTA